MKMERGYPVYTVTPKAENVILRGHPWVYDAEILNTEGETANVSGDRLPLGALQNSGAAHLPQRQ